MSASVTPSPASTPQSTQDGVILSQFAMDDQHMEAGWSSPSTLEHSDEDPHYTPTTLQMETSSDENSLVK